MNKLSIKDEIKTASILLSVLSIGFALGLVGTIIECINEISKDELILGVIQVILLMILTAITFLFGVKEEKRKNL